MAYTHKIIIIVSPVALFMGKMAKKNDVLLIEDPLLAMVSPQGLQLVKALGNPTEIVIGDAPWYEVKDDKLIKHYIKETTGLIMVDGGPLAS